MGDGYVMRSPRMMADRRLIRGGGSVMIVDTRTLLIIKGLLLLQPGIRLSPVSETIVPLGGAAMNDIRQLRSDSEVSDDELSSGGGGGGGVGGSVPCGRDRCVLCAIV